MDRSKNQLRQHMQKAGHSLTKPRLAVFAALQDQEPQTMRRLIAACPSIDRASIYRTIALFEKLGIVQRLQIGWKYKLELTDSFSRHHHHLTCLKCGRVIAFDESTELIKELRWVAAHNRFKIRSHQLEIQGLCESCRKD